MHPSDSTEAISTDRRALIWFVTGLALGIIATLLVTLALTPSARRASDVAAPVDYAQIREAARQGAAEAIREAGGAGSGSETANAKAEPTPEIANIAPRANSLLGNAQAPVVIVEFSDFECSYCRSFYQQTLPRIIEDYVNSGKVQFSYRHFPILADSSFTKAEAAECAGEQGRFWDYHNALFSGRVAAQGDAQQLRQGLVAAARELNLDVTRFQTCLDEGRYRAQITEDYRVAQQAGVRGTPSFFINGKLLVGAQPLLAFRSEIEAALTGTP